MANPRTDNDRREQLKKTTKRELFRLGYSRQAAVCFHNWDPENTDPATIWPLHLKTRPEGLR